MEEKKTIFDYLGQVFLLYGIMTLMMNIFCVLFGEPAKEISAMFALGSEGLSVEIMMQYFIIAIFVTFSRFLFFTDIVIKKMPVPLRTLLMVISVIGMTAFFIVKYGWFPSGMPEPWIMFILCFSICFGTSLLVMALKEKAENTKMEEALKRIKEEEIV